MKKGQKLWTEEQLLLTINLYSKITFGQMDARRAEVIEFAELIGRSANAVALKLVNFASLDPRLKQKGMSNASDLDRKVWGEYMQNWDDVFFEGEILLAKKQHTTIEKLYNIDLETYQVKYGREAERKVKVRLDQSIFRGAVLTNFNNQCCITGLNIPELIVASHIAPWSIDKKSRLDPRNGLALNALHDKAFDKHLITVTEDLKIKISPKFYQHKEVESVRQNFIEYDGKSLIMPKKYYPGTDFLKIHNEKFGL